VRRLLAPVLIAMVCAGTEVRAQSAVPNPVSPAPIVTAGLKAYVAQGPASALTLWLEGSQADSAVYQTLHENFSALVEQLGRPVGYDVVRVWSVGPNFQRTYLVLRHEQGPAFAYLEYYQAPRGWIMRNITFNTDLKAVFPAALAAP
jgi:hypothetical protein